MKKAVIIFTALFISAGLYAQTAPLYHAIDERDLNKVKQLVRAGADVNKVKVDGRYSAPLAWACANGAFDIAYYLLDNGADPNGSTTYDTALWWLSYQLNKGYSEDKSVKLAEYMIKKGAKVDMVKEPVNNGTPLMAAAGNNSRKLVDLYLKYGADKSIKDDRGRTAADHAELAGHIELANYLRGESNEEYRQSLIYAVRKNDLGAVKRKISETPSSQRKDLINKKEEKSERTPLHYAAKEGYTDIAVYLVENGADINVEALGSFTPLHTAAAYGHSDIAIYLINKGANINVVQSSGCATGFTSMNWAITHSLYEVVRAMLENGGNPYSGRQHPLISARRDLEMVKILVEEGNVRADDEMIYWFKKEYDENYDPKYKYYYDNIKKIHEYLKAKKDDLPVLTNTPKLTFGSPDTRSVNREPDKFNKGVEKAEFEPFDIRKIETYEK